MKTILNFLLILNLVNPGWMTDAAAAIQEPDRQVVERGRNELKNGGFENGLANWTASGGSFAKVTTASNVDIGNAAASWDSNAASQTLVAASITPKGGLLGSIGVASCRFKVPSGTATHELQLYDGTNIISKQTINNSSNGYIRTNSIAYIPTSTTSLQIRIISVASNEPLIYLDDCYLGKADGFNTYSFNSSRVAAVANFPLTASCAWARTSATIGDFSTDSDCPAITVERSTITVDTTNTFLPQIKLLNAPIGVYKVTITQTIAMGTAGAQSQIAISDGTNTRGYQGLFQSTANTDYTPVTAVGVFEYTSSQSTLTFKAQAAASAGNIILSNATSQLSNSATQFIVEYYPPSTDTGMRADSSGWKVDANISGANPSLGTSAVSSYTGIENASLTLTNNPGSANIAAQIPCSSTNSPTGTTCAVGNESVGVSFTVPNAGDVKACASFSHSMAKGGSAAAYVSSTFQIVETPNNDQTILQEGKTRVESGVSNSSVSSGIQTNINPLRVCGNFTFTSTGQKTIRLMYEQVATDSYGSNITADASAASGQRDIHWEVYPLNVTQNVPIVFQGLITSGGSGKYRIEAARVTCSSSSSVNDSTNGAWITVSNISSNRCTGTFASGIFSGPPVCTATNKNISTVNVLSTTINITSSTAYSIGTVYQTGATTTASINEDNYIICIGPN